MNLKFKFQGVTCSIPVTLTQAKKLLKNHSNYIDKKFNTVIIKRQFFSNEKAIPDTWRYCLTFNQGWQLLQPNCEKLTTDNVAKHDHKIRNNPNNILIVLESPHKDEYTNDFTPISPAAGDSGINFQKYFISHIVPILESLGLNLDKNIKYNICFVNPVQYQASLYEINKSALDKKIRNIVWKELYSICKGDFINRVISYEPAIVLNGCTADLKPFVANNLRKIDAQIYNIPHPSSWSRIVGAFKKA